MWMESFAFFRSRGEERREDRVSADVEIDIVPACHRVVGGQEVLRDVFTAVTERDGRVDVRVHALGDVRRLGDGAQGDAPSPSGEHADEAATCLGRGRLRRDGGICGPGPGGALRSRT